jgi:hypothetical protein
VQRLRWGEERPDKPRKGRWSQTEIALLKDWYGLRDEDTIARELNRSPASIKKMAVALYRTATRSGPWTAHDVQELKRYLGATSVEVIGRILGRDTEEVRAEIFELGRIQHSGRWSREDTKRFKRIYGTRSDEDLAVIFSRSVDAITAYADKLHLAKDKAFVKKRLGRGRVRMPRWDGGELELLRGLYPGTANIEIAEKLSRSVKSVVSKAHHMGLKKDAERLRTMGRENVSLRYAGKK